MPDPGKPTILTEKLTLSIRERVLAGKDYKTIQQELEIADGTWDYWVFKDFQDFRKNLNSWKKERMIKRAERTIDTLIDSEEDRVKLDASKFILERLNKDEYASRTENTGKDGKDLIPTPIYGGLSNPGHGSDEKDLQSQEEN